MALHLALPLLVYFFSAAVKEACDFSKTLSRVLNALSDALKELC